MSNSRKYPLVLAKEFEDLLNNARSIESQNCDIVKIIEDNGEKMKIIDLSEGSPFFFSISNPVRDVSGKNLFTYQVKPGSQSNLSPISQGVSKPDVLEKFKSWIDIIIKYNSIKLTQDEKLLMYYEKEFYSDFEIVDSDADQNPFSSAQQETLNGLLLQLENEFEAVKDKYQVTEIKNETEALRKQLSSSTKRIVIKRLGKIFPKIKKMGIDVAKDLLKEGFKEGVKYLLKEGYMQLINK